MKKVFILVAIFAMAFSANAQVRDSIQLENAKKMSRLYTSEGRYEHWTDAYGNTEYLKLTGLRLGVGVSGQYLTQKFGGWEKGAISPMGQVSLEIDGRHLWCTEYTLEQDVQTLTGEWLPAGTVVRDPVDILSYELCLGFGPRWTNQTSVDEGTTYFAFDTDLFLKIRLLESKFVHTRWNAILGIGYTFRSHKRVDDFGQWTGEDGEAYHIYDPVSYQASGVCAKAGFGLTFRGNHSPHTWELKALATYSPYNTYGVTSMKLGAELSLQWHIALGNWHMR